MITDLAEMQFEVKEQDFQIFWTESGVFIN